MRAELVQLLCGCWRAGSLDVTGLARYGRTAKEAVDRLIDELERREDAAFKRGADDEPTDPGVVPKTLGE